MSQEEAVIKALEDYGGKATNKQIYELALKYGKFGGKTPKNTIRWWLQKSKKIKPTEGRTGSWELLSYQEEKAELKKSIQQKDAELAQLKDNFAKEIALLKEMYSSKHCVTLEQVEALVMECPDWATAKDKLDDINRSEILAETDWAKVSKRIKKYFREKTEKDQREQTDALKGTAVIPSMNDNNGIVAGGNIDAKIELTDNQTKIIADRLSQNEKQKLLG